MNFDAVYAYGLSLMRKPPFPGGISLGAVIVRAAREMDPDEARADRAWVAAREALDEQKRSR